MHMGRINHSDPGIAANLQSFRELRYHGARSGCFHRSTIGHEIILHVYHDHGCLRRVDRIDCIVTSPLIGSHHNPLDLIGANLIAVAYGTP
jgi:hypothetical protein